MITIDDALWACGHSWYYKNSKQQSGLYIIWVYSCRPEGGILPFQDIDKLKAWVHSHNL